ncbi:MAG: GNAT family N-acetyltransferase [Micromonosporaceae bacterium]
MTTDHRVEETADLTAVDPREWDRLVTDAGGGFYLSHGWLSALHGVDGFAERNLLVRDGAGTLVAGLNLYTIERATNPLYNPHQVLAPDTDPAAWEPQLVIGGRSGYSNGVLADTDEGYAAVAELATAEVTASGCGSAAMMYLSTADARRMAALLGGTVPVLTGFRSELPIGFDSFDGYLAGLSKNRRKHVHRDLRRFAESGCRIEITALEPYVDQLGPLLGNVQRHHGVDIPDELHAGYLRGCARGELAGQAVVFQCFHEDRLIGFTLAFAHHGRLTMRVTGLDYERTEPTGAHFSLLFYEPVRYALAHGIQTIDLGTEAYRTKLLRGGELVPLWSLPVRAPGGWTRERALQRTRRLAGELSDSVGDLIDVDRLTVDQLTGTDIH